VEAINQAHKTSAKKQNLPHTKILFYALFVFLRKWANNENGIPKRNNGIGVG
jgi:hypothetical protein